MLQGLSVRYTIPCVLRCFYFPLLVAWRGSRLGVRVIYFALRAGLHLGEGSGGRGEGDSRCSAASL